MSQIICPISGEILLRTDLLLGLTLAEVHPIFRQKKELILTSDTIFKFQFSKSYREKKLYFLSVLNTTDLIDFHHPANPSPWIMEATFIELAKLAQWVDFARHQVRGLQLPRYAVREDNREMKNISIFVSELQEIYKLFLVKSKNEDLKKILNAKAADIEREYKRASVTGVAFTPSLARWALELAGVEEGMYERWRNLLLTPLADSWTLNKQELEEMLEHFQAELPINNDQVIAVLGQIKKLLGKNKEGFIEFGFVSDEEGGEDESSEDVMARIFPRNPGPKIDNGGVSAPLINIEDIGPEPNRKDYPKSFMYTMAKAKWDMLRREAIGMNKLRGEYGQF